MPSEENQAIEIEVVDPSPVDLDLEKEDELGFDEYV